MSSAGVPDSRLPDDALSRLVRAGLVTGIVDGLFASVQSILNGSTPARVFQGVASVLFGRSALDGGNAMAAVGLLMHFCVAFTWSAVFLFVAMRLSWVRRLLASPLGVLKVAALYGPFIWTTMSLGVIPLLTGRPPTITARWWVQFFGHIPFVGLPIVASIALPQRRSAEAAHRR